MISMRGVRKVYSMGAQEVQALRGVDLDIGANEYVAVVGPSGSGKSTLMNILGCLDTPTSGEYLLSGESVGALDRNRLAEIRNKRIGDRKSTRLNSSHMSISYAVFCLK